MIRPHRDFIFIRLLLPVDMRLKTVVLMTFIFLLRIFPWNFTNSFNRHSIHFNIFFPLFFGLIFYICLSALAYVLLRTAFINFFYHLAYM